MLVICSLPCHACGRPLDPRDACMICPLCRYAAGMRDADTVLSILLKVDFALVLGQQEMKP